MKGKTIAIAIGLGVVGLIVLGVNKVKTLQAVFDKMTILISGISNVGLSLNNLTFKLNFIIKNPTNEDFSLTGASIVNLKSVAAYRKGVYLGQGILNLSSIKIPAYSSAGIENVQFSVPTEIVLANLLDLASFDVAELTLKATVEVLGTEYIIEN